MVDFHLNSLDSEKFDDVMMDFISLISDNK